MIRPAALLLFALPVAAHAAPCSRVLLTTASRQAEAARVSAAAHTAVRPAVVSYVLAQGPWRLVWATPDDRERGVYLFRDGHIVDVWGGVLQASERQDAISWATQPPRRVPAALARCFADAVIAGR